MLGWDGSCGRPPQLVVICSKISTFAVSSTTSLERYISDLKKSPSFTKATTEM